jgi:hypothetical protein
VLAIGAWFGCPPQPKWSDELGWWPYPDEEDGWVIDLTNEER